MGGPRQVVQKPGVDKSGAPSDHPLRANTNQRLFSRTWAAAPVFVVSGALTLENRVEVTVGDGDRLEYVLKKFRRQITKAGLFQDMKRKRFYESPGALRRRKDKAAARRKVKSARRREHH
jgi:small subunit ribosomal protein S21